VADVVAGQHALAGKGAASRHCGGSLEITWAGRQARPANAVT
jgi:hypothetical protein